MQGLRIALTLALIAAAAAAVGCGGGDSEGGTSASSPGQTKDTVPAAVRKFADQLRGCASTGTNSFNYGGLIGSQPNSAAQRQAVAAIEAPDSKTDYLVYRSGAEAKRVAARLGSYRASGGNTEVRGLLLLAHSKPLGNVSCIETARKAAGPTLPDPPPAAAKLTPADRQLVLKASLVSEYCANKANGLKPAAFGDDTAATSALRAFLPLLEKAPDVAVKMQDNYSEQTPRQVAHSILSALNGPPRCLDPALAQQLAAGS